MFDAGSAVGKLGLDISEYTHGILEAQAISSVFPQVVTEFLAEPLLGLIEIAKKAAEWVGEAFTEIKNHALEAGKAAAMTGVSVEFLSSIAPIAGGVDNLSMALKFLQNTAFDSIHGNKELAKTFNMLGIDVTDGIGGMKGGEELLLELADAMKDIPDAGERISVAMQLMSRSGADMLPFLMKGAEGIRAVGAEQKKLGAVVSSEEAATAKKLARLGQMWDSAWIGIKATISEPIFKLLGDNAEGAREKIMQFSESVRNGIEATFAHFEPIARRMQPALQAVGEIIARVVSPAFEALKPLLRSGLLLMENLAQLAVRVLAPALKLLEPIFTAISRALAGIFENVTKIIDRFNEWAAAALKPVKAVEEVVAKTKAAMGSGGAGGGGGAPTTQPVVTTAVQNNGGPVAVQVRVKVEAPDFRKQQNWKDALSDVVFGPKHQDGL